jgi:hypothetical protein
VDIAADVASRGKRCGTGVNADSDGDADLAKSQLSFRRRFACGGGIVEGIEEGVALGVHFGAATAAERAAQRRAVLIEYFGVTLRAELVQ